MIDVGTRISAPFCAGLLGELGAEVIKVEDPRSGDFMRHIGPFVPADEDGPTTRCSGRSRGGAARASPATCAPSRVRTCSAGWRPRPTWSARTSGPGTLERWHIGPDDCRPELVWVRVSIFGQDGPNVERPGLDRLGIAYGGLLHLTGEPDRPPVRPGVTISDYLTGRVRCHGRHRRPLPSRRRAAAAGPVPVPWSTRRSTARSCGCSSGRSPATTSSAWCGAARATASTTRRRSTTTRPPTARYVCIVAGSDANFPGCARRWIVRTWPRTRRGRRWPSGRPGPTRSTASSPRGRRR